MSSLQWTPEVILYVLALVVASILLTWWVTRSSYRHYIAEAQVHRAQEYQRLLQIEQQRDNAEKACRDYAVIESRLQAQLDSAAETEERLQREHATWRQQVSALSEEVEMVRDKYHHANTQVESLQTTLRVRDEQLEDLRNRLAETEQQAQQQYSNYEKRYQDVQQALSTLQTTHARLETELQERTASHAREVANFEQQKIQLSEHFKLLSNEILERKTQALQETSKLSLHSVMAPFKESIESFKKEVQDIHHRESAQQGELRQELESLRTLNQKITLEAHELATALRGQKKLQGNWGELVLENVLDRSGLCLGKDYKREVSITTEEGRLRPDVVVFLPQGKHLVIDAKVSLNAYTRYVNADDDVARQLALKDHVSAIASHIQTLASRDYSSLPGLNSPAIVFMFIPIESAFVEALKADEALFQQAIENKVLVATPTTLLTSLNIIRQLWRYEDQNKHTLALASKADAVFKKLNAFLLSFEKIRKSLDNATQAYITAENQLVSGRGNLVKQVSEFQKLAPSVRGELPQHYVEKAELELELALPDETEISGHFPEQLAIEKDFPDKQNTDDTKVRQE